MEKTFNALWHNIVIMIPNVVVSLIILVLGYYGAKIVRYVSQKFFEKIGLDNLETKIGLEDIKEKIGLEATFSTIFSNVIFYTLLLIIVMSVVDILQIKILADSLQKLLLFLPNLFGAIFIVILGMFFAKKAKNMVEISSNEMNIEYGDTLAKLIYLFIMVITVSLGIEQLEIKTDLLNYMASIIMISIGIALALSLGLGTKRISTHIISGNYLREIYKAGDNISIDGIDGEIIMVGNIKTIIKTTDNKELSVPNYVLLNAKTLKG